MNINKEISIEKAEYDTGYSVYEFGTYGRSSVLAGQTMKRYLDGFDSLEEAQEKYPSASIGFRDAGNTFAHLPGDDSLDEQGSVFHDESEGW